MNLFVPTIFCATLLLLASSCGFGLSPKPGKPCASDDNCKSGSTCLGGYCSGGSCTCSGSDCKCSGDWECAPSSAPFSTGSCYLPCADHGDCPDTWGCSGDRCRYPLAVLVDIEGPEALKVGEEGTYSARVLQAPGTPVFEWTIDTTSADLRSGTLTSETVVLRFQSAGFRRLVVVATTEHSLRSAELGVSVTP